MRISDWSSDVCSSDLDATNPDIWDIDTAADTYRHRDTGLVYKPVVAGFKRQGINVYKPDGTEVGGDYVLAGEGGDISITVYARTDERRVGKEGVGTGRSGGSP